MPAMRPRVTLQLPTGTSKAPALSMADRSVLLVGRGFVARALQTQLERLGSRVAWTVRNGEPGGIPFGSRAMQTAFSRADAVVVSVPPGRTGTDPTLDALAVAHTDARWIGYLSATSVYGDRAGGWAFEGEAPTPGLSRGRKRADAELGWLERYAATQVFRLAGIYGPGRSPFAKLAGGSARVVSGVPGHLVNRIHVDDIVSALIASMRAPSPQDILNIADGHPADPGEVMDFAADLMGAERAGRVDLLDPCVSPMARSFYSETKRIDITRAQTRLGWAPRYSDYRSGLRAVYGKTYPDR